jgi:hypothetical protein
LLRMQDMRVSWKRALTPAVMPALAPALVACSLCSLSACSGANPNVFPDPPEAAPPVTVADDAGDLVDGPSLLHDAPTSAAICLPQSVSGYQPAWTPPEAWKQSVCTAAQISGFYTACLTPPISPSTCATFVSESGPCTSCLQSQDTAAQAGAIVWHESGAYWTVNVAGCIARAMGDATGGGCGAAYSAAIACRQQSCNACWAGQGTTTTFSEFATCEQQAGQSTCSTFAQAVPTTCGNLSQGAGSVCMPSASATAQEAYMQIAPLFCGP